MTKQRTPDAYGSGSFLQGSESILIKLKSALRADGDFPVRARVVSELRSLVNNPNTGIGQITEVILREPSLGSRVLHLVNSAFYRRSMKIMTVTQAVVQLGMRTLSDLCAGLVLMQKFVPAAQRGGIFAESIKRNLLTALLTSSIAKSTGEDGVAERGYLAGTFINLGYLLLAYYFPQVYEAAGKRARARGHDITQSITEILGIGPIEINLAIVEALDVPQFYTDLLVEVHQPQSKDTPPGPNASLSRSLIAAERIAEVLVGGTNGGQIDQAIRTAAAQSGFQEAQLIRITKEMPEIFFQHCKMIDMGFLTLPDFVADWAKGRKNEPVEHHADTTAIHASDFSRYTAEIRQAIENNEATSSIIATVMETLAFGLDYHRVILLLADGDNSTLIGRMGLGKALQTDPKSIRRPMERNIADALPEVRAFYSGAPQVFGDPLLEDGWPFAAIPIGYGNRAVGVIYADRVSSAENEAGAVDGSGQVALGMLADLLDQALSKHT